MSIIIPSLSVTAAIVTFSFSVVATPMTQAGAKGSTVTAAMLLPVWLAEGPIVDAATDVADESPPKAPTERQSAFLWPHLPQC